MDTPKKWLFDCVKKWIFLAPLIGPLFPLRKQFPSDGSAFATLWGQIVPLYRAVDLVRADVDFNCNIEDTLLPANSIDAVFASHILEHVDDRRALAELLRILKPGGKLIAMVPIIEAWEETYENSEVTSESERDLHFGQYDHVRFYGRDFPQRLEAAGFDVTAYMATPQECVDYGLQRGEKVFVAAKP